MPNSFDAPEETMVVDLELDDGTTISCDVITVLEVDEKDYIVLLPQDQDAEDQEVWFYGLKEDPDDPNAEPELLYIDSEEEYEKVADKFDEYLDSLEFDEMND